MSFTTYTASGAHDSNMTISLSSTSQVVHVQVIIVRSRNTITCTTPYQHQHHLDHLLMLLLPSSPEIRNPSNSRVASHRPNVGPPTAMTAPQSLRVNPLRHPANQFPHVAKHSSTLTSFTCGFTAKSAYQASSSEALPQARASQSLSLCRLSSHDVSSSFSFSVVSPDLTCSRHPSLR